jgi:formylglycine-generating enzyme required for sulfatase activity
MKKIFTPFVFSMLNIFVFGQIDIKEINGSMEEVHEHLYASRSEVSNRLYRTFIEDLKKSNNQQTLVVAQIDTLKWRDKLSFNEPYVTYYHQHPAYQNYPVVNVSYAGAQKFCEWLTIQYNANPKRKFKKVIIRLPSEKEWIEAAQAGDTSSIYAWHGTAFFNNKGQAFANFSSEIKDSIAIKEQMKTNANRDVIAPIDSYWKNDFGFFNMSGNVAEMVSEKGIAKGGSWRDKSEALQIKSKYVYEGDAQNFIGFRYFLEVLEE